MKKIITSVLLFTTLFLSGSSKAELSQSYPPFTGISISSQATVYISQADSQSVRFSSDQSDRMMKLSVGNNVSQDEEVSLDMSVENQGLFVKNGLLYIDSDYTDDIHISMTSLDKILIGGRGEVIGQTPFKGEQIEMQISGDGKIKLDVDMNKVSANIGGLGKIVLSGNSRESAFNISGSGKVEAIDLVTSSCRVNISGLGKCSIDAREELVSNISGSGTVTYKTRPAKFEENISGVGKVKEYSQSTASDTTHLSFGTKDILIIDKDHDRSKKKKSKAKPIWAGLELGWNSYMNADGNFDLPGGYSGLELKQEKSVAVSLNLMQKNFELAKSNIWFLTGLGITWNNYRFDNNISLLKTNPISTARDTISDYKYEKSKLVSSWLTAPLMFEFLSSRNSKKAFHFGAGVLLGVRIGSHTKIKFEDDGKVHKPKVYDDFNLSPFRYGFRVAIGYGGFNLFADYYASTMFKDKKGPSLYPVSVGVTLAKF